jgi:NADH dehydrogenase
MSSPTTTGDRARDASGERHIVIVGGGFAGTTVARRLQGRLPEGWRLTLLSEESYTTFNPMLAETVGASLFPEHVVAPLREVVDNDAHARFVMGRVTAIDVHARTLACNTLAGRLSLRYEHLVCAFGARARADYMPGMAEHAFPFKTAGDAMEIRNEVLRRLGRIELETDAALRARLGHFVVIGGGFSGVEVAGELADCLAGIRHYYPRIEAHELKVSLVQGIDRLLPELPPGLGNSALRSLRRRGVDVRLGQAATEVFAEGVRLATGEVISSGCTICALGSKANALVQATGVRAEKGRIVTAPDLTVPGAEGLWALGDCAAVPNAHDGQVSPQTAQFAVRQAHLLAGNLLAAIAGRPTRAFDYRSRGMMATIGHQKGVAEVWGVPLSGLPAWFLWRAYYLTQMPTLRRKARILGEWTWGLFFRPDITHMRFQRSAQLARADARAAGSEGEAAREAQAQRDAHADTA